MIIMNGYGHKCPGVITICMYRAIQSGPPRPHYKVIRIRSSRFAAYGDLKVTIIIINSLWHGPVSKMQIVCAQGYGQSYIVRDNNDWKTGQTN